jgi:hypothetical protein
MSLGLWACAAIGCVHTKSTVPFHEDTFKDPYWALIYVYREESWIQSDRSWGVFLDENVVGRLRQGAYLTLHAAPGSHSLYVGGNASRPGSFAPLGGLVGIMVEQSQESQIRPKEFKAKSGEVYFFRCKGTERQFLTREQAIGTLRTMKYDQGN